MHLNRFLCGLALAVPAMAQVSWVQWNSGTGANGHYYAITPTSVTSPAQESYAVSLGAHLVSINSAQEQAFLNAVFGTSAQYWIGFNDAAVEGTWKWTDRSSGSWSASSPGIFAFWAPGEPNDYAASSLSEDYAVMNWNSSGEWNDIFATESRFGIIEATSIPEAGHAGFTGGALVLAAGLYAGRARFFNRAGNRDRS
jgi:hypothetical protein